MIQIARDLGYTVVERDIARAELYLAEEIFLTGTAAEMVPVREIDDHEIGRPGEVTCHVQAKFMDALHGRADEYLEWLDFVDVPAEAPVDKSDNGRDGAQIGAEEIESTDEQIGRITPAA